MWSTFGRTASSFSICACGPNERSLKERLISLGCFNHEDSANKVHTRRCRSAELHTGHPLSAVACLPYGENCLSRSIKPQHGQNRCKRVPVSLLNAFSNPCMRLRNGFSFICPVRGTRGRGARATELVLQVNPLSWFKSKRTTSSKRIHFKHVSVRNMIAERCVETGGRMSHGVETRIIKYRFTGTDSKNNIYSS